MASGVEKPTGTLTFLFTAAHPWPLGLAQAAR